MTQSTFPLAQYIPNESLAKAIDFIVKIDALKKIQRKTSIICGGRLENSAEHSWHLMMMAMALQNFANDKIDLFKTLKMLSIHDLGETGNKDVYLYDTAGREASEKIERQTMQDLCALLPQDTADEFLSLWQEFLDGNSAESKFARALDRFEPFLSNAMNSGGSWIEMKITKEKALEKNAHIGEGSQELWNTYQLIAEQLDAAGYFHKQAA